MELLAGCPNCGASKKFPEAAAGKLTVCGACNAQLQIPTPCKMPPARTASLDETAVMVNVHANTHELIWIHGVATKREEHRARMSGRMETKKKATRESAVIRSVKKARNILRRMLSSLHKDGH